jgi:aldehyde:ferredoxin oxidoreductase
MGSKRLKAILARGSASVVVHNAGQFRRGLQRMNRAIQASSALRRLSKEGTAGILELVNYAGALPTRNFQQGQFEQADAISADAWRSRRWKRASSCASCSIACGKVAHTVDGGRVDNPEYETIFAAGSNLGIGDQEAILRMAQVCDEYGIDTISAGAIIAFTMEMFEKGIISGSALDGIEPRFGDVASAQALLGKLARMEGCGVWLSEGVARIAQRYPQAAPFAMHSKGLEMPAYHPNAAKGVALGYAVSERGACHLRGAPISELLGAGNPRTTEGKASLLRDRQIESALWNSAILCSFPSMGVGLDDLREVINAATGFDYAGAAEFKQVGERIVTLCRLFNVREGFTRPQDTLPARSLSQPLSSGPAHGQVVELNPMLDEYYALMGWDAQGIPTHECVHRLGLEAFVTPPRL